jgi:hypothetical protein
MAGEPGTALARQGDARRPPGGSIIDHRPAGDLQRDGVDQAMIEVGHRQAKIAGLARLVTRCLGLVDAAQKLGEDQRDAKTDRAKPRA